jgi:hypothetical protein
MAAYAVVLHRYSGQEDIIVGAPMARCRALRALTAHAPTLLFAADARNSARKTAWATL